MALFSFRKGSKHNVNKWSVIFLLMLLFLSACGRSDVEAPATITFAVPDWEMELGTWSELIEEFEADNPDVQANGHTTPIYFEQIAMSSGTGQPEAAWRWLEFLSRQPPPRSNLIPARRSVTETVGYWKPFDEAQQLTLATTIDRATRLSLQDWPSVSTTLEQILQSVWRQEESPEAALAAAQAQALTDITESLAAWTAQQDGGIVVEAAGQANVPPDAATINFTVMESPLLTPYQEAAQRFHEANRDVVITVSLLNAGSIEEAASQADCFQYIPQVDAAGREAILSLDPFVSTSGWDATDVFPTLLSYYQRNGQLWGLPVEAQPYLIVYDRRLLDAAGQVYPTEGWSKEDFLAMTQQLTSNEGEQKQYGFAGIHDLSDLVLFIDLGNNLLLDTTQGVPLATFTSPEMVEIFTWYTDLYRTHGVKPPFSDEALRDELINNGRTAMWAATSPNTLNEHVGLVPLPGKKTDAIAATRGFFISAQTAVPQVCWRWIEFLSNSPFVVQWDPAHLSQTTSPDYTQRVGPAWAEAYLANMISAERPSLLPRLVSERTLSVYLLWLEEAYRLTIEQNLTPAQALEGIQTKADQYHACLSSSDQGDKDYVACQQQIAP